MKRKIITDQNPPSAQESPKEFSELLKEYHSISGTGGSGSSLWKIISGAAAVAVIVSVIAFWNSNPASTEAKQTIELTENTAIANTPLEYDYTTFSTAVANNEETLIITPEGVIIEVPAGAFASKNNSLISDSIELELTHYDDALAIIMSQIPMHYDSAGTKYHFQSDGMFQLAAMSGGEQVFLNKELTVHYPQTTGRPNSSTYFLTDNEWVYKGTSPTRSLEEVCKETVYRFNETPELDQRVNEITAELSAITQETEQLKKNIETLKKQTPLEPRKQNLNNYRFYLDVNPAEFPELSSFKQVLFEVKDSRFNFSMFDQTWSDITLKKSPREGRYLVTLKSGIRVEIFDVYPVLEEDEFDEAFSAYSEELTNSLEKQKSLAELIAENEAKEALFREQLELQREETREISRRKKARNQLLAELNPSSVYRTVSLNNVGTVNFDLGIPFPTKGMPVPAEFYVAERNSPIHQVSFIDVKDNIFYSFTRAEFPEFRFLKGKKYVLTSVLPDGTVLAYTGDFNSDNIKRGQPHRFKLEVAPSHDITELKAFLGLGEPA